MLSSVHHEPVSLQRWSHRSDAGGWVTTTFLSMELAELGPCGLHYEGRTIKAVPGSCAPIPELVKARSEPVGTLVPISAFG